MRGLTFFPIEDIAQPARAPAAPAAELTSVASVPPFGMPRPRAGPSTRAVSGWKKLSVKSQHVKTAPNKPSSLRAPPVSAKALLPL